MRIIKMQKRKKGFMLFSAVLSTIVFMMLAGAFFTLYGGQFSLIQNGRIALQAQQYGEIDANTLSLLSYDDLDSKGAHARQAITNISNASGWEDQIVIGAEQIINEDTNNKQRIATVNIYKTGDTQPRYTQSLPLSSQGSSSIPTGTIVMWSGAIASIPSGWVLCNGSNGTPDLRNRFIVGAGTDIAGYSPTGIGGIAAGSFGVSQTGGEQMHNLTISEIPSHNHFLFVDGQAYSDYGARIYGSTTIASYGGHSGWNEQYILAPLSGTPNAGVSGTAGDGQAHNNMPPYYSLAYIMKL